MSDMQNLFSNFDKPDNFSYKPLCAEPIQMIRGEYGALSLFGKANVILSAQVIILIRQEILK